MHKIKVFIPEVIYGARNWLLMGLSRGLLHIMTYMGNLRAKGVPLYRGCCYFNMYKTNQLTGNVYNDSVWITIKVKEDIRSCYVKYVFC